MLNFCLTVLQNSDDAADEVSNDAILVSAVSTLLLTEVTALFKDTACPVV